MTDIAPPVPGSEPVERPDPQLIQQLFDEDPLKLTDQQIDTIILAFRQDRVDYLQPKPEKVTKAKASKALPSAPELPLDDSISLGDLGL